MSATIVMPRAAAPRPAGPAPRRRAPARAPAPALRLPFGPRAARRWLARGALALVLVAMAAALVAADAPGQLREAVVRASVRGGLEVREVAIAGRANQPEGAVRAAVYADASTAMLDADLPAIRARLIALPWVADATVARRFPGTIAVTLTERRPAALWRWQGRLALIDPTGEVLATENLKPFAKLPIVAGAGAGREFGALEGLLATAPTLGGQVDGATWVGARRWDLRMKTGEVVALPEGYGRAEAALAEFARLDAKKPLLGRGFVRFDLRLPGKMVVRVSDVPGAQAMPSGGTAI